MTVAPPDWKGRPPAAHRGDGPRTNHGNGTVRITDPGPLLASRTRKARRATRCALDCCAIRVGDRVGLVPGAGWAAVACIVARQAAAQASGAGR